MHRSSVKEATIRKTMRYKNWKDINKDNKKSFKLQFENGKTFTRWTSTYRSFQTGVLIR
jgi:hypothetical protein